MLEIVELKKTILLIVIRQKFSLKLSPHLPLRRNSTFSFTSSLFLEVLPPQGSIFPQLDGDKLHLAMIQYILLIKNLLYQMKPIKKLVWLYSSFKF